MDSGVSLGEPVNNESTVSTYFLACECKPGTSLFSVIDPFAYDVQPAYINGTLGIIHYSPLSYAIIDVYPEAEVLLGYILTVTHPDTILLLDKIKGFNGKGGFNFHTKTLAKVHTSPDDVIDAWIYILSDKVLECYESLEQVEYGLWDSDDEKLSALLTSIQGDTLSDFDME